MEPTYLGLYLSGELKRRAEALEIRLASCDICPRECHVNRLENEHGFCHSGYLPIVSAVCDHHGEEPAISGSRGTGAIFFGNCNMRCVYCQNYQISQDPGHQSSKEIDFYALAQQMIHLQNELGCHNISFISPSHFVPQLVRAVLEAVPLGLRVPIVYNTNAYDSIASLQALEGIVDIYLPDLRYASDTYAAKFSHTADYVTRAREAILEMYRQAGDLMLNDSGLAQKGLIVRHLILPNGLAGSRDSFTWLFKEVSPKVTVSIMSQYYPAHLAPQIPQLQRKISLPEYLDVLKLVDELGLENGWIQDMEAADNYLPHFDREGHLFSAEQPQI
ncbi:MAG: radical SAM protein [Chloroflexi bacterium CG_4_9_14_3_um_filter_45_9]|nr:MAG: radical SAM protein [Chloroflexi bacterium CG_4_9_14_3_um_filter_45_9]